MNWDVAAELAAVTVATELPAAMLAQMSSGRG